MQEQVCIEFQNQAWCDVLNALLAGDSVKGFALTTDADGFYTIALHIDGHPLVPLNSPPGINRIRAQ